MQPQQNHPLRLRAGGADVAAAGHADATAAAAAAYDASPSKSTRPKRPQSAAHTIALASFFVIAAAILLLARQSHNPTIMPTSSALTASFMPPSKAWLDGTRLGNVDDGISKQDVQNLIAEGAKSHDSFRSIIGESICSKNSPVAQTVPSFADLDALAPTSTTANNVNLTSTEVSQLIYRAMHENQYGPARYEAINRLQHWDEWLDLSTEVGVGMLDFECPSANFLLFDGFTLPVGLGSNLRRFGNVDVFRTALSHNRVFLYVNGDRPNAFASCDRMDLQCSFAPMSPCVITQEEMDSAPVAPHDLDAYLRQNPDERIVRVKQKAGYTTSPTDDQIHGLARSLEGLQDKVKNGGAVESSFVNSLATALSSADIEMKVVDMIGAAAELFITRPNRRMRGIIEKALRESFPIGFDPNKAVGLPIRASDKCKKEAQCINFGEYMGQLHSQFPLYDMRRIVLTSEDETIIKASESYAEERDEDFTITTNTYDVAQGSGAYNDLPHSKKDYSKEDILTSTMTSWAFQLEPGYSFLNFCSNFHVVIFNSIRFGCGRSNSASVKKQNITCNVGTGVVR